MSITVIQQQTFNKSRHNLVHPSNTLTTWGTLSTALVLIELDESMNCPNNIGLFIHHNNSRRTQTRLCGNKRVEIHKDIITDILGYHRCG